MNLLADLLNTQISIEKWHGARNDFLFIQKSELEAAFKSVLSDESLARFSLHMCERNQGLGADGVVVWQYDEHTRLASAGIWNSDGSRAQTCGNALRCLAGVLLSKGLWNGQDTLEISALELNAGKLQSSKFTFATLLKSVSKNNAGTYSAAVAMGRIVELRTGLLGALNRIPNLRSQLEKLEQIEAASFVQLANPHLVLHLKPTQFASWSSEDFSTFGRMLQAVDVCQALQIPVSNIGFVELPSSAQEAHQLNAVVFERGAGLTACCGSGGCAMKVSLDSAAALSSRDEQVNLKMPGGVIGISIQKEELILTGPAQKIASFIVSPH